MILYKYVTLDTGLEHIIKGHSLKFSTPASFNDPHELSTISFVGDENTTPDSKDKKFDINHCYGILCLTRNPANLLMWAHYAKGERSEAEAKRYFNGTAVAHGGLVIGIDINEAGLNNEENYLIPAKFGSMIYTATKPVNQYLQSNLELLSRGELTGYNPSHIETLQRVFLNKSQEWAYEEEVRVVKKIKPGRTDKITIPKSSIKSVYLGSGIGNSEQLLPEIRRHSPNAEIYAMELNVRDWGLTPRKISHIGE